MLCVNYRRRGKSNAAGKNEKGEDEDEAAEHRNKDERPYAICIFGFVDVRKPYAICISGFVDVRKPYIICMFGFVDVRTP